MRRQKLDAENMEGSLKSVSLNDDGEIQGVVFCLHCHKVNDAAATECEFCHQPLTEPPSDLRDRLQRISQQASHREPERPRDKVLESIEEWPDKIRRPFAFLGNIALKTMIDPLIKLVFWGFDRIDYIDSQLFDHHLKLTITVILWITIIVLVIVLVAVLYRSFFTLP